MYFLFILNSTGPKKYQVSIPWIASSKFNKTLLSFRLMTIMKLIIWSIPSKSHEQGVEGGNFPGI